MLGCGYKQGSCKKNQIDIFYYLFYLYIYYFYKFSCSKTNRGAW